MANNLSGRSDKSKEKWADSLMDAGTTIHKITFVTLLASPLTAVVTVFLARGELPLLTYSKFNTFMLWVQGWAVFFFPIAIYFGIWLKNRAMDTYDDLEKTKGELLEQTPAEPDKGLKG